MVFFCPSQLTLTIIPYLLLSHSILVKGKLRNCWLLFAKRHFLPNFPCPQYFYSFVLGFFQIEQVLKVLFIIVIFKIIFFIVQGVVQILLLLPPLHQHQHHLPLLLPPHFHLHLQFLRLLPPLHFLLHFLLPPRLLPHLLEVIF